MFQGAGLSHPDASGLTRMDRLAGACPLGAAGRWPVSGNS
uniref:Uncharacterized protein n=1 Tax=uncultured bacterium A1Q1_fos_550 TaxID=1256583 RepID=L7VW07_9BACT|nr:hypothetical protein [uncultured bacterium A1Q1_fos_550]